MTYQTEELNKWLSANDNLLEDKDEYHELEYRELCIIRANKAFVYKIEMTPIKEIYDKTGEISVRCAFINKQWTIDIEPQLNWGNAQRISVQEFLKLLNNEIDQKQQNLYQNTIAEAELKARSLIKEFAIGYSGRALLMAGAAIGGDVLSSIHFETKIVPEIAKIFGVSSYSKEEIHKITFKLFINGSFYSNIAGFIPFSISNYSYLLARYSIIIKIGEVIIEYFKKRSPYH